MSPVRPPYFGAAYYPEGMSESRIDYDIKLMKETGINAVRLGEFAWSRLEPEDGRFDFGWLCDVVDKLAKNDIGVILCTPSATPPAWLTQKHPEIMPMRYNGRRASHGARLHYCPNSAIYREYIRRINTAMAKQFADCDYVLGWQIDNEVYIPFGEGCYCPDCQKGFAEFLQSRFHTIDRLNQAWQLTLWSQEYSDFSQVPMPRPDTAHHPSLKTAWLEFQEQSVISYVEEQIDTLKSFTDKPVSTDMMPLPMIDHVRANEKADMVMFNHYCSEESLPNAMFWFDYLKTLKDAPFWNTETDPNANGGTSLMPYKPRGFCTVNTWLSIMFGGEANLYWHWRGHRAGHELMHGTVIDSFGRPTYTYAEVVKLAGDMRKCSDFLRGTRLRQARVAIHYSAFAEKLFAYQSIGPEVSYIPVLFNHFYFPLIRAGIRVDVIAPDKDLSPYDIVISPLLPCLDEKGLRERLDRWIENGGIWIAGPLTDIRDRHCAKLDKPFGSLEEWGGVREKYFTSPNPAYKFNIVCEDGNETTGAFWYDGFEPAGAASLAVYGDKAYEFEGLTAIAENKKGRGAVICLGTVPQEETYLKLVRSQISQSAYIAPVSSENVLCVPRVGPAGDGFILAEYRNKQGTLTLTRPAVDLITGKAYHGEVSIAPYTVMVMKYTD